MNIRRNSQYVDSPAKFAFALLFLYTIAVLVRPHEFSLQTADYQAIRIFAVMAFVAMILSFRPLNFSPQLVILLALLPLVMISAYLNGWGVKGIEQSEQLLIGSIIPFFLYSTLVSSPDRQRVLMLVSLVAAMFMVANGHIQQQSFDGVSGIGLGGSVTVGKDEMRISYLGFFSDPNDLGMFLVMNLPFAVYFLTRSGSLLKIVFLLIITALFYGVYMTSSRGTLISGLGVMACYFFIKKASGRLIIFSVVCAPFVLTLLSTFGGLTAGDDSVDGRLQAWYAGIQMLFNNPVFGVGMGNFTEEHVRVAHNSYIHVAGELGVPGYSLWGGVLMLNMLASYSLLKRAPRLEVGVSDRQPSIDLAEELLLNKTLFFSMVGFMISAFFLSRQYVLTMFIFLGMQTASLTRVVNILPELHLHFTRAAIARAAASSWLVIVTVYLALKVGL